MARAALFVVRWVLPLAIAIAGVVLLLQDDDILNGAGVGAIGVAVMVWLFNLFLRGSIVSNADRDREEAARLYMEEHGRWPDEG